jgi:uncharacterized protein YggE
MRLIPLLLAVWMASGPAAAQDARPFSGIVVTGLGEVEAVPDMATASLGVRTEAETAQEAMAANSDAMEAVLQRLRSGGIDARDVQTNRLSLYPRYEHDPAEDRPEVRGYVAENSVSITVRDLDRLGEVLDAAIADGANTLDGLDFSVADPARLEDAARAAAMADARRKAEQLAAAAGAALGPVRAIEATEDRGGIMFRGRQDMAQMAESVPIAPGEIAVTSRVTVTFDLAR